ncbi:MAG: hypothetical protein IT235_05540, partial [Bacteroidia bacterium]|nr:hypothetical protein [Bacteroidia bacterium]
MIRKAAFYFTLPTLIIASHCYPKGVAEQEELAKHWMRNQPVRFLENKGQMMDENGAPVPNVFFKVEAPG